MPEECNQSLRNGNEEFNGFNEEKMLMLYNNVRNPADTLKSFLECKKICWSAHVRPNDFSNWPIWPNWYISLAFSGFSINPRLVNTTE